MTPVSSSVRRAQPLLGTFVEITANGAPREALHAAVGPAFGAVAAVHRLMSFHEGDSDVSRSRSIFGAPGKKPSECG